MKNLFIGVVLSVAFLLVGCGEEPVTEADLAAEYGLTMEEFQEQKEAAARMNMSVEDHLKHGHGGMDH